MSRITGSVKRIDVDRRQWSDLNRHRSDLKLLGRGEGYVEELYFGKGFSRPPTFTYSAVFNDDEQEVLQWAMNSPRGSLTRTVDQYGMGNDSQSHGGMFEDPGFESQGKYRVIDSSAAASIPLASTLNDNNYKYWDGGAASDSWLPLRVTMDTNYTNDSGEKYSDWRNTNDLIGAHRWLQTDDTRDRWALSFTESHDIGVGEAGAASAEATISSSGFTNWLIPINKHYWQDVPLRPSYSQYSWRTMRSLLEMPNDTVSILNGGGIYAPAFPPPNLSGFRGFLWVNADADVTVHVNATLSAGYVPNPSTNQFGTKVMPDSAFHNGTDTELFYYREIDSIDFSARSTGTGWRKVEVELPYAGWSPWPNAYECLDNAELPSDVYWTFRVRVEGTQGVQVNVDNIFLDRLIRNAEVPMLTIGVDEWIQDDAGVYIGAKLWVILGTPTGDACRDQGGG